MADKQRRNADGKSRCAWIADDALMLRYHDQEWGVPVHNDRKWFEFMVLDAFQAGLSWKTVLHKRAGFRRVFHNFAPERIAALSKREINAACRDASIIRNRMKIEAAVKNAVRFIAVQEAEGSFDAYIWSFTDGHVVQSRRRTLKQTPVSTRLSDRLSKDLKSRGFSFVGTTICYAFLQAGGIVNDHLLKCFRHAELGG